MSIERSRCNRIAIENSSVCGCYFCITIFPASTVIDWADKGVTGLYPHCGVDAVLPEENNISTLSELNELWFCS